jgi:hypothetical protein
LSLLHEYLAGINEYISARIALSQSIRRAKLKLWSAIRVKLRLGVFAQMHRDQTAIDATAAAGIGAIAEEHDAAGAEAEGAQTTAVAAASSAAASDLPVISISLPAMGDADDSAP